jgi:hypothetical protein
MITAMTAIATAPGDELAPEIDASIALRWPVRFPTLIVVREAGKFPSY